MDFFSGKVRLGGSLMNEVHKINMSAAEVVLLRAMHGADAVVDLRRTETSKHVEHDAERARLAHLYGGAHGHDGKPLVYEVFGAGHTSLPTKVPGYRDPEAAPTIETIAEVGPDSVMA